jgi:hypothetical protein
MRQILAPAFVLCAAFSTSVCAPAIDPDDHGQGGPDASGWNPDDPPATQRCTQMDILFVIDDSGSMAEEQTNLASNFPAFAGILNDYLVEGTLPLDYRVAITTTGVTASYVQVIPGIPQFGIPEQRIPGSQQGDDGAFRQRCNMSRTWLERTDNDMVQTFACAANVGTNGPGLEMPLYASELALSARIADGRNAGFLRDDALLAVVYLTDEDDCSHRSSNFEVHADRPCSDEPVAQWVQFFDNLKGARGRWATAVIAGPTDCSSQFGDAAAAHRLQELVQLTGGNGVFASICEGNLAGALQQALDTFTAACETFPPVD